MLATAAILAQGTSRVVATTQAFSRSRFEDGGYATAISMDRADIPEIHNVIPLSWFVCIKGHQKSRNQTENSRALNAFHAGA